MPMKGQALLPGVPLPRIPDESPKPTEMVEAENSPETDDWPALHDMMGSLFVFELDNPKPQPVQVLGLDQRELPPEAAEILEQAQVVAGGKGLLDRLFPQRDSIQDGREYHLLRAPLEPVLQILEDRHKLGRRVVVLADGDPLFFGIGATLARGLDHNHMRCMPGVTSLQEACARMALPWHEVRCVSLHGRHESSRWAAFNVAVFSGKPVCVLTDATSTPDVLARHLLDRGVEWLEVWACQKLNQPGEKVRCLSLREAASLTPDDFHQPCTVLLRPVGTPRRPYLGLVEADLAVEKGLITKPPVRAAALSLLRIQPQHVVWDVGAGSGAVSLEACALAHEGCVVALERSPGRALSIGENRRRFGAAILEIQQGLAPDCFHQLPDPQRVFIGGGLSGDNAQDILEQIALRLPKGGRIVVSCVLLGSMQQAVNFFQDKGWPMEMMQMLVSEAAPLADDVRFVPQNPVFLIAGEKI